MAQNSIELAEIPSDERPRERQDTLQLPLDDFSLKRATSLYSVQSVGLPIPHVHKKEEQEENASVKWYSTLLDSVIFRMVIAVLFIALGIVALWFSIQKSLAEFS